MGTGRTVLWIAHTRPSGRRPAADCSIMDKDLCYATTRRKRWVVCRSKGDGGHGKQAGVGRLVAGELLDGPREPLEPFRFSRYQPGRLHPNSIPLPVEPKGGA